MGVYRAAFTTIDQTEPIARNKVKCRVVALGGEKGLGDDVGHSVRLVANHVEAYTLPACGHFLPEECPENVASYIVEIVKTLS